MARSILESRRKGPPLAGGREITIKDSGNVHLSADTLPSRRDYRETRSIKVVAVVYPPCAEGLPLISVFCVCNIEIPSLRGGITVSICPLVVITEYPLPTRRDYRQLREAKGFTQEEYPPHAEGLPPGLMPLNGN